MRLIDADALELRVEKFEQLTGMKLDIVHDFVGSAPTIDAVRVVRCKDCVDMFHDDWYKCFACANLYGLNEEVKPNDYCSHGERKTEQTERSRR